MYDEYIELVGNTFDNIKGAGDGRCVYINFKQPNTHRISLNSIINCQDGGFYIKLIFPGQTFNRFTIDSFTFSSNSVVNQIKGGLGVVFGLSESITEFDLYVQNCTFQSNTCQNKGGAIHVNDNEYNTYINYHFVDCKFISNSAPEDGGAIAGNIASGKAGAIYVENENPPTISNCQFESNTATNNGGAIYIKSSLTAVLTDCHFKNCKGSAATVITEGGKLDIDSCSVLFDNKDNACCAINFGNRGLRMYNTTITRANAIGSIQFSQNNGNSDSVSVQNCIFDECYGTNTRCFTITVKENTEITFSNNIIQNMKRTDQKGYFGSFSFTNKDNFILTNVSFINNECSSTYGGGSGLWITGTNKVTFDNCKFINNAAYQLVSNDAKRPIANSDPEYYNGDGGAIQYGHSASINDVDLEFNRCTFTSNKAFRHGGAVALQTIKTVVINECTFEENVAGATLTSSSELLFENHYGKKSEGRGAIYINPSYSHSGQSSQQSGRYMTSVSIKNCIFTSNSAYDGFAIYIEGDDAGTEFSIRNNIFTNNVKLSNDNSDSNSIYRAVIASEISNLFDGKVLTENTFNNDNSENVNLSYVDHYGVPILATPLPTPTFSPSPEPTRTNVPGTDQSYINQEFANNISPEQIVAGTGTVNQISGCRFTNISVSKDFFIKADKVIPFYDNIFETTIEEIPKTWPGVMWIACNGNFVVHNCQFTKIRTKDSNNNANIITVSTDSLSLTIDTCTFINCGLSNTKYLINFQSSSNQISFLHSTFYYDDNSNSCGVLTAKRSSIIFDDCEFTKCGKNTINIEVSNDVAGTFQFSNNKVKSVNDIFIKTQNEIKSKINISGNIFEDSTLANTYYIYISHNQGEIELCDNVFSRFSSSGIIDSIGGGIASIFTSSQSQFTLKYNKCQFIDIVNSHTSTQFSNGGAIQYGYSSLIVGTDLVFTECTFTRNKAYKHGGAISIQTAKSVLIQNCVFTENKANNGKSSSSSNLLFEDYYDQKNEGRGGAIYLNPTFNLYGTDYQMTSVRIEGCTFNKNTAEDGYAIYFEGEDPPETTIGFIILNNIFNNNYNENNDSHNGASISSEILSISKVDVEGNNEFSNLLFGQQAQKFIYVDHSGLPIPATQSPTASISQSPTASISQSPTASVSQTPTASVSQTPTASVSQTPTASVSQTPTASVSQTPTASVSQTPTASVSQTPTASVSQTPTASISQSPTETPTASVSETPRASSTPFPTPTLPSMPSEIIFGDNNYTDGGNVKNRCEEILNPDKEEERNIVVNVVVTEFNSMINNNGGAIHLINCGLSCKATKFYECKSISGGGGGIFINKKFDILNGVKSE